MLTFELTKSENLSFSLFDLLGKQVFELPDQIYPVGKTLLVLSVKELSSGAYLSVFKNEKDRRVQKLIIQ